MRKCCLALRNIVLSILSYPLLQLSPTSLKRLPESVCGHTAILWRLFWQKAFKMDLTRFQTWNLSEGAALQGKTSEILPRRKTVVWFDLLRSLDQNSKCWVLHVPWVYFFFTTFLFFPSLLLFCSWQPVQFPSLSQTLCGRRCSVQAVSYQL